MMYKGFRIEETASGLSVMVWKDEYYLNSFNSATSAKKAIDEGRLD